MTANNGTVFAVDGATGYVGSHLVDTLCKKGYSVRAIVHNNAKDADCQFLESCGAKLFKTDLDANSQVLKDALNGATCMVHLIGSIAPPKGQKLEDLHAGQSLQMIEACKRASTKVVLVTALGTSANAVSLYHRTKSQSEELLKNSGLPFVILRPSLILGKQAGRRDSKLMTRYIKLIHDRPRVPLIGGGKNLLQPVFVGDLSEAIINAATDESLSKATLEIGGPEVISMHDLISRLMDTIGIRKPLQALPVGIASILAPIMETFQSVPLLSSDQVKLAGIDNICSDNAIETVLKVNPKSLKLALDTYKNQAQTTKV